jgi:hypothetical protein
MKRWSRMLACLVLPLLLVGAKKKPGVDARGEAATPAPEQSAGQSETPPIASTGIIESFKIPERDATGNLLWLIQGEKAKIVREGRIRIFNMQVETYRKGEIDQTMKSAECFLIRQSAPSGKVTTHAESTNQVSIVGKNIVITADGFEWFPEQTRLVMQKNVQVVFDRKKGAIFKGASSTP